jgi:AraC-like DNA-binding protein
LAGLPVDEVHDQNLSPEEVFAPHVAERLNAIAKFDPDEIDAAADALCEFIRETSIELKPLHATMICETTSWLSSAFSPPLEELYARIPLSQRQIQRLSKQYFGSPPTLVLKRFRAVRAAILLSHPELPKTSREEVFSAYFDQSHLIKDIRRYSGRTPRLLDRGSLVGKTFNPEGHGEVAKPVRASLGKDSG